MRSIMATRGSAVQIGRTEMLKPEEFARAVQRKCTESHRYYCTSQLEEDVTAAIGEYVAAERERCAKLVESYDARDAEGEFVRPGLGEWTTGSDYGMEAVYTPNEVALAKAIRDGAIPPTGSAPTSSDN
jgi:hypothetical protein